MERFIVLIVMIILIYQLVFVFPVEYNEDVNNLVIYKTTVKIYEKQNGFGYVAVTNKGDYEISKTDYYELQNGKYYIFYAYALNENGKIIPCEIKENMFNHNSNFILNGYEELI